MRNKTKKIMVGDVPVGGDSPISVQSMTNTDTSDISSTVKQILTLQDYGCDIIRLAVNSIEDAKSLREIKKQISIPVVADIQFDYKLGLYSLENGYDCLRINPGNIGSRDKVEALVKKCQERNVPIRIGVNSGSLSKETIDKYGGVNENSLVQSALDELRILEDLNFDQIKISIKSSDVMTMIKSYRKIAKLVDYPLHLGVTEAGPKEIGTIKSSIGIGSLLAEGIGDTIRVSLTGDPVDEVKVGVEILKSLRLRKQGVNIISCPTCSRTKVDLIEITKKASESLRKLDIDADIAIMGCPVNGPGEAKQADLGLACGDGYGLIFKKGHIIKRVEEDKLLSSLIEEAKKL